MILGKRCVERSTSTPCSSIKDRQSCLTSTESRSTITGNYGNYWKKLGYDIFESDCVWCPDGPCTGNNKNRCEPKIWMTRERLTNFESCLTSNTS